MSLLNGGGYAEYVAVCCCLLQCLTYILGTVYNLFENRYNVPSNSDKYEMRASCKRESSAPAVSEGESSTETEWAVVMKTIGPS